MLCHAQALSEHLFDFDDFHDAYVTPGACVVDVIRARAVCPNASSMLALQEDLRRGVRMEIDGKPARLSLVRCTNTFAEVEPTHFRSLLNSLWFRWDGRSAFAELQVLQRRHSDPPLLRFALFACT